MTKAVKTESGLKSTILKALESSLGDIREGFSEKRFRKNIEKAAEKLTKGYKSVDTPKAKVKTKKVSKTV
jgi:hypothetical protein